MSANISQQFDFISPSIVELGSLSICNLLLSNQATSQWPTSPLTINPGQQFSHVRVWDNWTSQEKANEKEAKWNKRGGGRKGPGHV